MFTVYFRNGTKRIAGLVYFYSDYVIIHYDYGEFQRFPFSEIECILGVIYER